MSDLHHIFDAMFDSVRSVAPVREAGGSGYTASPTHPDPRDPNDDVRQRTQARPSDYPYDMPVSYGRETVAGDGQLAYQLDPGSRPPPGEEERPDRPLSVWDRMSDSVDMLRPREIGPQGLDAAALGYGVHGRLGDGMVVGLDFDPGLDLVSAFCDPLEVQAGSGLLDLLLGPDASYDQPWNDTIRDPEDDEI